MSPDQHIAEITEIAEAKLARRVARAKSMTGEQRLIEGVELFEESLQRMKAGVRFRHPDFSEEQVLNKVNEQLKSIRENERATTLLTP